MCTNGVTPKGPAGLAGLICNPGNRPVGPLVARRRKRPLRTSLKLYVALVVRPHKMGRGELCTPGRVR